MITNPLISVIVPVYNVASFLPKCLDSLVQQTYSNLEIILVNDGSTDDSASICHSYAFSDSRIKVIEKANGGLSSARNAGLEVATGDWISFIDSDDWVESDLYERCIDEVRKHPDANLIRFGLSLCFPEGDNTSFRVEPFEEQISNTDLDPKEIFKFKNRLYPVVWASLYKHQVLKDIKLSFLEGLIHEDEFFTAELYGCSTNLKARYLPFHGYNYRQNREGAIMQTKDYLRSLDHLTKDFTQMLQHVQTTMPSAIPLLNTHALNILHEQHGYALIAGRSMEEVHQTMEPFFVVSRQYKLLFENLEHRFIITLFRYSPALAAKIGRFYQPIARRLGSKIYT